MGDLRSMSFNHIQKLNLKFSLRQKRILCNHGINNRFLFEFFFSSVPIINFFSFFLFIQKYTFTVTLTHTFILISSVLSDFRSFFFRKKKISFSESKSFEWILQIRTNTKSFSFRTLIILFLIFHFKLLRLQLSLSTLRLKEFMEFFFCFVFIIKSFPFFPYCISAHISFDV